MPSVIKFLVSVCGRRSDNIKPDSDGVTRLSGAAALVNDAKIHVDAGVEYFPFGGIVERLVEMPVGKAEKLIVIE